MYQPFYLKFTSKIFCVFIFCCSLYLVIAYAMSLTTDKCLHPLSEDAPNNVTASSTKMHQYGIPQPIWQQIGGKTLATTPKLDVILLTESQWWFWSHHFGIQTIKMGLNHVWVCVIFQYRGLYHFDMHCTLIIEAWLKSNIQFGYRYLELWNACLIS